MPRPCVSIGFPHPSHLLGTFLGVRPDVLYAILPAVPAGAVIFDAASRGFKRPKDSAALNAEGVAEAPDAKLLVAEVTDEGIAFAPPASEPKLLAPPENTPAPAAPAPKPAAKERNEVRLGSQLFLWPMAPITLGAAIPMMAVANAGRAIRTP
jgi:hypothetical protein